METLIGTKPGTETDIGERTGPPLSLTSSEKVNAVIHYYRGEMGRMTSWRDRIDRTSNWAITVVAACCRSLSRHRHRIMVSSCSAC